MSPESLTELLPRDGLPDGSHPREVIPPGSHGAAEERSREPRLLTVREVGEELELGLHNPQPVIGLEQVRRSVEGGRPECLEVRV